MVVGILRSRLICGASVGLQASARLVGRVLDVAAELVDELLADEN